VTFPSNNYGSSSPVAAVRSRKTRSEANAERYVVARGKFSVLGISFDVTQIPEVILQIQQWIAARTTCHYIAVTGMHGITEARHKPELRQSLADADLVVPDGMPVIWIGRFRGHHLPRRVYGPELMLRFCETTSWAGYRHYFLGGAPGVLEKLAASLEKRCPGVTIVGMHSPAFGPATPEEDSATVKNINLAAPDVLWLGLGTPRQEIWMLEHREKVKVPVIIGVGAAFDLLSSRKTQAPEWMRERGLEWLFRLLQEPRRLWKRYLVGGCEFVICVLLELLGLWRFE
jgi:N-acetylglucosaminyldiphosphoundecaprenol N-acetyl-beta-D-mannosaminyltransferase